MRAVRMILGVILALLAALVLYAGAAFLWAWFADESRDAPYWFWGLAALAAALPAGAVAVVIFCAALRRE